MQNSVISLLVSIALCILYFLHTNQNNEKQRYSFYVVLGLVTIQIGHTLSIEYLIVTILTFLLIIYNIIQKLDNKDEKILLTLNIISSLQLMTENSISTFLICIILELLYIFALYNNNMSKNYILSSFLSVIPFIYINPLFSINIHIFISLALIVISTLYSIYNKKIIYSYIPILYTVLQTVYLCDNTYLLSTLLLIISLVHYQNDKEKVLYKFEISISSLLLYINVINSMELGLKSLIIIGYYIFAIYNLRKILTNYIKNNKTIEYIVLIFINFLSIINFTNEFDGLIYSIFILIIAIIAYNKKYGPTFLISLADIVINLFILTRVFWFSIPWWIYVLIFGIILITIAIINESKENNTIRNKINELKEKLNL